MSPDSLKTQKTLVFGLERHLEPQQRRNQFMAKSNKNIKNKPPTGTGAGFKPPTPAKLSPLPKPMKAAGGTPPVVTTTKKTTTSVTTKGSNTSQAPTQPSVVPTPTPVVIPKTRKPRKATAVIPAVVQQPPVAPIVPPVPPTPTPKPVVTPSPSWWKRNKRTVLTVAGIVSAVAMLAGLAWRLYPLLKMPAATSSSITTAPVVTTTEKAVVPDEQTRKMLTDATQGIQKALLQNDSLRQEISRGHYAYDRALDAATRPISINGNDNIVVTAGSGSTVTVNKTTTINDRPKARVPKVAQPPPTAYYPSQVQQPVEEVPPPQPVVYSEPVSGYSSYQSYYPAPPVRYDIRPQVFVQGEQRFAPPSFVQIRVGGGYNGPQRFAGNYSPGFRGGSPGHGRRR